MDLENWDPTPEFPNFYLFFLLPCLLRRHRLRAWMGIRSPKKNLTKAFSLQWISKNAGNWLPFFFWVSRSPNQYGTAAGEKGGGRRYEFSLKKGIREMDQQQFWNCSCSGGYLPSATYLFHFPFFICGEADRSGRGEHCSPCSCSSCCCCTIFQFPMFNFFGCEKEKKCLRVWKGKKCVYHGALICQKYYIPRRRSVKGSLSCFPVKPWWAMSSSLPLCILACGVSCLEIDSERAGPTNLTRLWRGPSRKSQGPHGPHGPHGPWTMWTMWTLWFLPSPLKRRNRSEPLPPFPTPV